MERGFAVIGLGYVGLPVALALAKKFEPVIGFDISNQRIAALREWKDATSEVSEAALRQTRLHLTHDADALNQDRKSTRLNSSHRSLSRMPSSA